MTTDITEKGLETLIVRHMTGADGLAVAPPPTPAALLLAERAIAGRATVLVVGAGFADMLPPPAPPTEGPRAPR